MKKFLHKWNVEIVLLALFGFLFLVLLPRLPIFDADSFYYIAKARKILTTGDWLNIHSFMAKPILGLWLMALSYKLFGVSLFSTYLWHTLVALLSLVAVYLFAAELVGKNCARLSAAILLTALMFFYQTASPMLDIPLLLFIVLAHWQIFRFVRYQKSRDLYFTALWAGLAFLTKGLLGAALPAVSFFLFLLFFRINPWRAYQHFFRDTLVALLIFGAVVSVWLIPQLVVHGQKFGHLLYEENIVRFFHPIDEVGGYNHVEMKVQRDPQLNLLYFLLAALPWSPLIFPIFGTARRQKYFGQKPLFVFLSGWVIFFLVISSLSGHYKGPRYLLPLLPGVALLMGLYLSNLTERKAKKIEWSKLVFWLFLFLSGLVLLLLLVILTTKFTHGENQFKPLVLTLLGLLAAGMLGFAQLWRRKQIILGVQFLFFATVIAYSSFLIMSTNYIVRQSILYDYDYKLIQGIKVTHTPPELAKIVLWRIKYRAADFYWNNNVVYLSEPQELAQVNRGTEVLTTVDELKQLKINFPHSRIILPGRRWCLLRL